MASAATTKNQPPDIDIIMFQIRPGMAKWHLQAPEALPRRGPEAAARLIEIAGDRPERLVEAESHIPGLAGENRKDRSQLRSRAFPGKSETKNTTVKER